MVNCEQACIDMVRNYAKTGLIKTKKQIFFFIFIKIFIWIGCGKTIGGSRTVSKYDAGGCGKAVGKEIHTCA
jgi:hypothetical protein